MTIFKFLSDTTGQGLFNDLFTCENCQQFVSKLGQLGVIWGKKKFKNSEISMFCKV
jgi:hypothetical protein